MNLVINAIKAEMKPSMGCTEPVALALAVSRTCEHLVTEGIELRCVGVLADKGAALIGNSLGDADNEVRGFLECSVQVIIELL